MKVNGLRIACALVVLNLFSSCSTFFVRDYAGDHDPHSVTILVLKTKNSSIVSSKGRIRVYRNNREISTDCSGSCYKFSPLTIHDAVTVEPTTAPLLLNGNPYRGSFTIFCGNGTVSVINKLKIDQYLLSVVPGEIPAGWEHEALKAQAVASRTFTYYHMIAKQNQNAIYDIDATAATQVYRGMADETIRTSDAVRETSGQVMVYKEKPILSYFHSTCGGKTIDDRYVWNQSRLPYLKGVTCGFCNESSKYSWESTLLVDEIINTLSNKYPAVKDIRNISFKKKDDRVVDVLIRHSGGNISMSGNNFRLLFPADKIRSLYFTSKKTKKGLVLTGHGWGHGVGLCQWGARGMALRGYSYRQILNHYYLGVSITSVRNTYIASKLKTSSHYQ